MRKVHLKIDSVPFRNMPNVFGIFLAILRKLNLLLYRGSFAKMLFSKLEQFLVASYVGHSNL